jgi:DNA-binding MarR family transcriptional regulator
VADGLVERSPCTTDARGAEAILTDAGLRRLRAAAPTHLRGIQATFLDAIAPDELAVLERVLRRVSDQLPDGPFAGATSPASHAGSRSD